jgi:hypothetical protein
VVLQRRDGHGVELDGLDVLGSEVQRGEDLVATCGADDQLPPGRATENVERDSPRVAVVAGERGKVAVERPQPGAWVAVVDQHAVFGLAGKRTRDIDAEHRAPIQVLDTGAAATELARLVPDIGQYAPADDDGHEHHCGDRSHRDDRRAKRTEHDAHRGEDQRRHHDDRGRSQPHDEGDREHAAEPGAHEVGEIQALRDEAWGAVAVIADR